MLEYFLYFKLALEKNYVNTLLHNSLLNNVLSILRVYSENLIPHNLNNLKNFEYLVSDFSSIIKRTNTKVHPMVFITT